MSAPLAKRREIRLVAERAAEMRQLAWIDYSSSNRELYIGLGRSPHHISRHSSGKVKITTVQVPLEECVIPVVPLWPHIRLSDLTLPLRENFGSLIFLVDTNCWPDYALYGKRKHKELILYPLERVKQLTLQFWLADSRNRNFLGWPNTFDRTDEVRLEDDIFLAILAEMDQIT